MVAPDDVSKGDVDLPRHVMCHHLGWRHLYYMDPRVISSKFQNSKYGKEESVRTSKVPKLQTSEVLNLQTSKVPKL
jgi:hypothetical protein